MNDDVMPPGVEVSGAIESGFVSVKRDGEVHTAIIADRDGVTGHLCDVLHELAEESENTPMEEAVLLAQTLNMAESRKRSLYDTTGAKDD